MNELFKTWIARLVAIVTPENTDVLYVLRNGVSRKITIENLKKIAGTVLTQLQIESIDNLPNDTNGEIADLQTEDERIDDRVDQNELDILDLQNQVNALSVINEYKTVGSNLNVSACTNGKNIVINNDSNNVTITVDVAGRVNTFEITGTGSATFIDGSGITVNKRLGIAALEGVFDTASLTASGGSNYKLNISQPTQ